MSVDLSQFETAADPLLAYLSTPVDSPPDADAGSELQPDASQIHDGQPAPESVATTPEATGATETQTGSAPSSEAPVGEPANPLADLTPEQLARLREQAGRMDRLEQAYRENQELQRQQQFQEQMGERLTALADLDESSIGAAAQTIIAEVQRDAVTRMQPQLTAQQQYIDHLEHGFTALIAALESRFDGDTLKAIETDAKAEREAAATAKAVEDRHKLRRELTTKQQAELKRLTDENTALRAQLAGQTMTESGVFATESGAVGSGSGDEPTSVLELLLSGKL